MHRACLRGGLRVVHTRDYVCSDTGVRIVQVKVSEAGVGQWRMCYVVLWFVNLF
jgi:hypothetical protein